MVTIFALWKKNHCTRQSCRSDINEKNSKLLFIIFFFNSTSVGTLNPCLWFYNFLKYQLFPCLCLCNKIFNKRSKKNYISIRHNFEFDKARFRKFYMIFIVVLKSKNLRLCATAVVGTAPILEKFWEGEQQSFLSTVRCW